MAINKVDEMVWHINGASMGHIYCFILYLIYIKEFIKKYYKRNERGGLHWETRNSILCGILENSSD